jgi:hypothetical protein
LQRAITSGGSPIAVATRFASEPSTASTWRANSSFDRTKRVKNVGFEAGGTAYLSRSASTNSRCGAGIRRSISAGSARSGTPGGSIRATPNCRFPTRSRSCAIRSPISSGSSRATPNTPNPPAAQIAAATAGTCEKPKIGSSMPNRSQTAVRRPIAITAPARRDPGTGAAAIAPPA